METDPGPQGPDALTTALTQVHEHHRRQVEAAVRAGRPHLVRELVEEHADEALRCITGWPGAVADAGPAESRTSGADAAGAPPTRRSRRALRP